MESLTPRQAEAAPDSTNKHTDERIKAGLEAQGWQHVGQEYPTTRPFNLESGRFEQVKVMTDGEITELYIGKYGQYGFDEVYIEVSHKSDTGRPNETIAHVYMRQSSKTQR